MVQLPRRFHCLLLGGLFLLSQLWLATVTADLALSWIVARDPEPLLMLSTGCAQRPICAGSLLVLGRQPGHTFSACPWDLGGADGAFPPLVTSVFCKTTGTSQ